MIYQTILAGKKNYFLFIYKWGGAAHVAHGCKFLYRPEEGIGSCGNRVTESCEPQTCQEQQTFNGRALSSTPILLYFWTLHIWICTIVFCVWLFLFPDNVLRHVFIFFGSCSVIQSLNSILCYRYLYSVHIKMDTTLGNVLLFHCKEGKRELTRQRGRAKLRGHLFQQLSIENKTKQTFI